MDGEGKMVSENNYEEKFSQARAVYLEGDYDQASIILDEIIEQNPEEPSALLLRGHIYLNDQEYEIARDTYHKVLNLTDNEDLVKLAHDGLEKIDNEPKDEEEDSDLFPLEIEEPDFQGEIEEIIDDEPSDGWTEGIQLNNMEWDAEELEEEELEDPTLQQNTSYSGDKSQASTAKKTPLFEFDDDDEDDTAASILPKTATDDEAEPSFSARVDEEEILSGIDAASFDDNLAQRINGEGNFIPNGMEDNNAPTFVVSSKEPEMGGLEQMLTAGNDLFANMDDDSGDYSSELQPVNSDDTSQSFTSKNLDNNDDDQPLVEEGEEDFFFGPDDLDDIPDIDAEELPMSSIFTGDSKPDNNTVGNQENVFDKDIEGDDITGSFTFDTQKINLDIDKDTSASSSLSEQSEINTGLQINPEVEVNRSKLSQYLNLSLRNKQLVHSGVTAIVTFVVVLLVTAFQGIGKVNTQENPDTPNTGTQSEEVQAEANSNSLSSKLILALIAGIAGGGSTMTFGLLMNNHIKRYLTELQNQCDSIYQGNYEVKVGISSQDEFGTLAAGFNQMTKMINTTTSEAKKRAEETERAREDLQRQVIRLLDDVEGAARGDLTVQAEVTADVLGAVADAFNLTINNLRKIVKQVQQAAIQVNKASADSELYARNQSSDALRMAEELAVTLNSVQMMTDSIQRVAENAQEAEEVARSSSVTALKGGDAVERTVAGILQIRETVSETTRKVKRLAEASQQISTIVAVISQISSRTNLLALNASIQAARAGEAGRGFAIVADEVRQLADRSAKSLQEIEQIVLQIQTETGSVMTAMEEGIQQVRDVTDRSEQAKRALEDIIQVSNRIDALVRSITADTDEQRENSRGVAKVMQEVELTAQATSQESQRVAGSLQNLVGIGKDLIVSVEKFKVD